MFGVVDDLPGAFGARSGHHVEVVHVVAGRGDRRAVIAVRHQHHVAGADLFEHLDRAVRRAVDPVVAEAAGTVRARGDLEVVDLLELGLGRRVLVVLVRGVARPVAAGGDDLARDQRVGLEDACGAEVVHLPAAVARAAQLDRDVGGGDAAVGERALRPGAADREPALAGDHVGLVDAEVDHVGRAVETEARGASSNVSPSHSTVPPPASGRIITSVSPVREFARSARRRVRLPAARIRSSRPTPG